MLRIAQSLPPPLLSLFQCPVPMSMRSPSSTMATCVQERSMTRTNKPQVLCRYCLGLHIMAKVHPRSSCVRRPHDPICIFMLSPSTMVIYHTSAFPTRISLKPATPLTILRYYRQGGARQLDSGKRNAMYQHVKRLHPRRIVRGYFVLDPSCIKAWSIHEP